MLAILALVSALSLTPPAAQGDSKVNRLPIYVALAGRFRPETADEIAAILGEWQDKWVADALGELRGMNAITPRVVLMETHTALFLLRQGRTKSFELHLAFAIGLSKDAIKASQSPDFYRPLYLLLASIQQVRWRLVPADVLLEGARQLFPADADLAVAHGCVFEAAGSRYGHAMSATMGGGDWPEWARTGLVLDKARDAFEAALAIDPSHAEARLRLGRVMYLQDRAKEARAHLARVHDTTADPFLKYMAALFLGRISEDERRLADATASYREATIIYPRAQAAFIALSHALQTAGDEENATRSIETMIDVTRRKTDQDDPWWQYHFGQNRHHEQLMAQLWKVALQ